MERVSFHNSKGLRLAGCHYTSGSGKGIVMAHGFTADKSMGGRFDRMAESLNKAGYGVLTFDFSGCGESTDAILTPNTHFEDMRAAIQYAKGIGYEKLGLYGHSYGSYICLRCYVRGISTMVLSGALTGPIHYDWTKYYTSAQLRELDFRGSLTVKTETPWRKKVVIGSEMLMSFEQIDQVGLLERVACPVLIIHGNSEWDEQERRLHAITKTGMRHLWQGSKLDVIEDAGHDFVDHQEGLIERTLRWFKDSL